MSVHRSEPPDPTASTGGSLDELPGEGRIGPYRLDRRLGRGGMGEVYQATDLRLERPVALKRIRSDTTRDSRARLRFQREARAAASLNHPNIVRIHDLLSEADDWIVMEWIEGRPLSRWAGENLLPLDVLLSIAVDIASALEAAHREGLIHRDLKAANVLVDRDNRAKLLDFGLAKRLIGGAEASLTLEGQVVGTPHAMSPEQAMGRKVEFRTDFFSLGSLLYELSTGVSPFRGDTPLATLHRVCVDSPRPAGEISPLPGRFSDLVDRLLEKDPARRPDSAGRIVAELREILHQHETNPGLDARPTARHEESPTIDETSRTDLVTRAGSSASTERRQLTVLCCRLAPAGSTVASPDLATLRRLPRTTFESVVRDTVERYEGYVEQISENVAVTCFGYPRIHEDDADRALLAGLELLDRLPLALPSELGLEPRAALGSGPAIVLGDDTNLLQLALGSTLDEVQRLARHTVAGQVWIRPSTHRLLRRSFATEPAASPSPESRATAEALRVLGPSESSGGWRIPTGALIARDAEMEMLLQREARSREGRGQVVVVRGEAGLGKSRLVAELRDRLDDRSTDWWILQGSDWAVHSPFQPLLEPVRRHLGLDEDAAAPLDALATALHDRGFDEASVPLFASLFGIPWQDHYPPLAWTAKKIRRQTFEVLTALWLRAAATGTTVLLVEDLHWIDSTTLEWLGHLVEALAGHPLFLVATARPHFESPWTGAEHVTELRLERLAPRDVAALIDRSTGGVPLAEDVRKQLAEKADGVPLFVEELTRSILESGQLEERDGVLELRGDLDDLRLPATLESSITARLDRLGSSKAVAQLASVLGREFPHSLLEAVSDLAPRELDEALDRLTDAGLVHRRGFSKRRRYVFRHALVQDAAYASLLAPPRRSLHQRIAECLEGDFPRLVETQPELLAHHYTRAEVYDRAVELWQRAGQEMFTRSAVVEAVSHLEKGVSLISKLDEGNKRDRIELTLQSTLGSALATKEGFSAAVTTAAYQRAYTLCSRVEAGPERFWTLRGLCQSRLGGARFRSNLPLCRQLVDLAGDLDEPVYAMAAHVFLAAQFFTTGRLEEALTAVDEGLAFDSEKRSRHLADQLSVDPGVNLMSLKCRILWYLGYTEEALRQIEAASRFASRLSHPSTIAQVAHCRTILHYDLRDPQGVLEHAHGVIEISRHQGSFWEHWTRPYLSWAEAMSLSDPSAERLGELRESLERAVAQKVWIGFVNGRPLYWSMAAQMWLLQGEPRNALDRLDEAASIIEETGEELYSTEIDCLRGQALLALANGVPDESPEEPVAQARDCFERARETALARRAMPFVELARRCLRESPIASQYSLNLVERGSRIETSCFDAQNPGQQVDTR